MTELFSKSYDLTLFHVRQQTIYPAVRYKIFLLWNMFKPFSTCFVIQNNSSSIYTKVNYYRHLSKGTFEGELRFICLKLKLQSGKTSMVFYRCDMNLKFKTRCLFLAESRDLFLRTRRWEVWELTVTVENRWWFSQRCSASLHSYL